MDRGELMLFALDATEAFGRRMAEVLGTALARHEEQSFPDGEHKSRPLENVRGRDCFVVQSLYAEPDESVNDKLMRLLILCGALRDASAAHVTAVTPYLCYARSDHKAEPGDPLTLTYIARCFEAVGVDRILTMDVHDLGSFQNAFRCATDHLTARPLFVKQLAELTGEQTAVLSPDAGGMKRAERLRDALREAGEAEVGTAFLEKFRTNEKLEGSAVVGTIEGRHVIILDDMVASGKTLMRAVHACCDAGARSVRAAVTHGLFVGQAPERLSHADALDQLVITSTVPPFRLPDRIKSRRLTILDAAPLFAEAVRGIHEGGSIADLLNEPASRP